MKNQEHWYSKDGEPRYDAGMKEVRAEGLLPSVTSVEIMIPNYGLELYKKTQLKESIKEFPYDGSMPYEEWWEGRLKAADKKREKAAQRGSVIHKMLERYLLGKPVFYIGKHPEIITAFNAGRKWIDENVSKVLGVETVMVYERYAGKADLVCILTDGTEAVVDWKTTDPAGKLKKNGEPLKGKLFYDSHCRQLAALTRGNGYMPINVALSTNPEYPFFYENPWTWEEREKQYGFFLDALNLFYRYKNIDGVAA